MPLQSLAMLAARRRFACAVLFAVAVCACGGASSVTSGSAVVARVGNETITQAVFDARLQDTLTSIQQAGGPATGNAAMLAGVRTSVLRSLILDAVIAQEAAYRGLAATPAQITAQVNAAAQQEGGMSGLQSALAQAGGSMTQLRDEIRSQLNEQRLEDYFARQRADQVQRQLASGASFVSLAAQWSDDQATASHGGDLGALTESDLKSDDPAFASAVRSLAVGEHTATAVRDAGGYDFVQLYARTSTTWSVRHILIGAPSPYTVKDRTQWFVEALFNAVAQLCTQGSIHVYVKDSGTDPCSGAPLITPVPSPAG